MIYYDTIPDTIIGDVLIAASDSGLCAVRFGARSEQDNVKALSTMFPRERVTKSTRFMAPYRRELEAYFAGKRERFGQPIDLGAVRGGFQRDVLRELLRVPFGQLVSYGELAARAGSPGAARAAGAAMAANPLPVVLPCHRVVAADGGLGGYTGGVAFKKKLLAHEGAVVGGEGLDVPVLF